MGLALKNSKMRLPYLEARKERGQLHRNRFPWVIDRPSRGPSKRRRPVAASLTDMGERESIVAKTRTMTVLNTVRASVQVNVKCAEALVNAIVSPYFTLHSVKAIKMRALLTICISILIVGKAHADGSERANCPGLNADATTEQQALCWSERAQSQDSADKCEIGREGINDCILQTARWCSTATFDDPAIARTCFLAHLRARQFDEAQSVQRYIQNPTTQFTTCLQALEAVTVRIVTVPVGAEVIVDGRLSGKAPLELNLPDRWWKSSITARFGAGEAATEIDVSARDLISALDTDTCTMAELTVRGPEAASPIPVDNPLPLTSQIPVKATSDQASMFPATAVVSLALGGAGLISGAVLFGIAANRVSYLRSLDNNTTWSSDLDDKVNSLKPLNIAGGVSLGIGAALVTVGIILMTTSGGSSSAPTEDGNSLGLRLRDREIAWEGRF